MNDQEFWEIVKSVGWPTALMLNVKGE